MTDPQKIKDFFTAKLPGCEFCRMDVISIRQIEIISGIPKRALFDFLKGNKYRNIDKHIGKLIPVLEKFGYIRPMPMRGESLLPAILKEIDKLKKAP